MVRRYLMRITDIGMILYWLVTALSAATVIDLPREWLFKDYDDPKVIAWNWSFISIDILFAVTGLIALRLETRGHRSWIVLATISLTLTVCAGLMAISYWVLLGEYDPWWWIPNLFLMLWPLPYLWQFYKTQIAG